MAQRPRKTTSGSTSRRGRRGSGKRDVVDTPTGRFFAQRTADGRFKELTLSGRSVARDRKIRAKTTVAAGYGHKGDQRRRAKKS